MNAVVSVLSASMLLLSTLVASGQSPAEMIPDHGSHPGLSHPEPGDADHHHGDADDHHESPDSPCHHHEDHTCCGPGATLALPNLAWVVDPPAVGFLPALVLEPHHLPSARELLHVPLA